MTSTEDGGLMQSLLSKSVSHSLSHSQRAKQFFNRLRMEKGDMARTEDGGLMSILSEASVGSARQASIFNLENLS